MGWVIVWLLLGVVSIGAGIAGIVFLFVNTQKALKLFKIASLILYLSLVSMVMSISNYHLWDKMSILLVFTTLVLLLVSALYGLLKNDNAMKGLKLSGVTFLTSILFISFGGFFEIDNGQSGEIYVSNDEKSSEKEMKEKKQATEAKKKEEEKAVAEAKKKEEEKAVAEAKKKEEEKAVAEAKKKEKEKAVAEAKKKEEEEKAVVAAKKKEEEKAVAEAKEKEKEKAVAEAKKKEEEKAVADAKKKEEDRKKELALNFDYDMEKFDELMNENQANMAPIVAALLDEQSSEGVSFTKLLASMEETVTHIRNMQDYSNLEKYQKTNDHFVEGSAHLIGAYVFFENFYKSDYGNSELFYTGFESYNKATDELTLAGEAYAKEYNQK